jgi:hypothetical protein
MAMAGKTLGLFPTILGEIMQLKMWTEESKNETNEEQLFVRLHAKKEDFIITLSVCNKDGILIADGNLAAIDLKESVFIMLHNIGAKIPLKKNYFGEIEVLKERECCLMDLIEKDRMQSQFTQHVMKKMQQNNYEEKKPTIN